MPLFLFNEKGRIMKRLIEVEGINKLEVEDFFEDCNKDPFFKNYRFLKTSEISEPLEKTKEIYSLEKEEVLSQRIESFLCISNLLFFQKKHKEEKIFSEGFLCNFFINYILNKEDSSFFKKILKETFKELYLFPSIFILLVKDKKMESKEMKDYQEYINFIETNFGSSVLKIETEKTTLKEIKEKVKFFLLDN